MHKRVAFIFLSLLATAAFAHAGDTDALVLKNLAGASVRPAVLAKDCPAFVLIFSTLDCPISNSYAPAVADLYRAFSARGVVFYVVYSDSAATPAAAAAHHHDYAYPCDGLLDPQLSLAAAVKAHVTSEAVVVGPGGAVVYRGAIDDQYAGVGRKRTDVHHHYLSDALADLLSGTPIKLPETKAFGCALEIK